MESQLAMRFGRSVWRSRRHAGFSQEELAHLSELHRADVGELERGLRLPRLDTILKLAAGLEVSTCVLLAGMHWQAGHYVAGQYFIEDGSERLARAKRGLQ
jgi:transcriptional regulator with XRE-family HTH domain